MGKEYKVMCFLKRDYMSESVLHVGSLLSGCSYAQHQVPILVT